jgi:protein-disulfide isomerase
VRTGKVRYELHFRSFLGRDSVRAAGAAAYAAQQNRMYQFADHFYRNQGPENSGYADSAFIRKIASEVPGLDPEKAVAAANDPLSWPAVRAGEQFARDLGSTGTPDFYVRQGRRLTPLNAQGTAPEDYARALDAALART